MNLNLNGKCALVCGGSKGIGKACALALAELGASVIIVGREDSALEKTLHQIKEIGPEQNHYAWQIDFDRLDETRAYIQAGVKDHPVDILINNSGGPSAGPLMEATTDQLIHGFNRHILVSHTITQLVVPHMKANNFGRIVNIISTSVKEPIAGLGVSNTIRGAMGNWSKTMANELGSLGITVNNVLPGKTRTGRLENLMTHWAETRGLTLDVYEQQSMEDIPLRRFAKPYEVGEVVAFLCTPSAGYITGTNVVVDGGRTHSL